MADRIPLLAISLLLLHLLSCSGAPANTFRSDTERTTELTVEESTGTIIDSTEPSNSNEDGVTIEPIDPEDPESVAIEISHDNKKQVLTVRVLPEQVTSVSSVAEDSTAVLADPVEILEDARKDSDQLTTPKAEENKDSSTKSSATDGHAVLKIENQNLNRKESNETSEASVIEITTEDNVPEDARSTESVNVVQDSVQNDASAVATTDVNIAEDDKKAELTLIFQDPVQNDAPAVATTEESNPEGAKKTESILVIKVPVQNDASAVASTEENIPEEAKGTESTVILQDPVQNDASADATTEESIPEDARRTESVLILQDPVTSDPSSDAITEQSVLDEARMTESTVILKDPVQNDVPIEDTTEDNVSEDARGTESAIIFKNDASSDDTTEDTVPEDARMTESVLSIKDSVQNDASADDTTENDISEDVRMTESTVLKDSAQNNSPVEDSTENNILEDARQTESTVLKDPVENVPSADDTTEENVPEDARRTESVILNDSPQNDGTDSTLDEVATESIALKKESFKTDSSDPEDVTESLVKSTDPVADPTDDSEADQVVKMEPQLVKIFDPSVDIEATTFLAEANLVTEPSATTESFFPADEINFQLDEELVTLVTADDSITTQIGTESGTESATETGTEFMSETTTLPIVKEPLPSINTLANLSKKRSYKGYKVYRVILPTEESVRRILSMEDEPGVEFWADPRLLLRPRGLFVTSAADVMVAPKIVPEIESVFRQARLIYTVLIDDVQTSIVKENPIGPSFARSQTNPSGQHRLTWQRYHRLADINSYLDHLKQAYPDWIEVVPIGKSSQGRPIQVIKLSRSRQPARVEPSQRKAILIDAGIHANEWITPAALTWMVNELVENADSYGCILDRFDWYFVPMVNPDGYEYSHAVDRMWRKTRRNYTSKLVRSSARKLRVDTNQPDDEQCLGADINRNFEFHWRKGGSSSNVCSPSFAGTKPFSEPESRALANFMLKQRSRLAMYISLHSYSQMWLLPWGFAETRPEDFSQLYSLAKIGARALQRVHNTTYLIGSVPDLLALASGTTQDWAKGVAGVHYSYTLEMRDAGERGIILPAQQIIPTAEETWAGIYAASVELAHRLYDHLPSCSPF